MLSANTKSPISHAVHLKTLTKKIRTSQTKIRVTNAANGSTISKRMYARNRKAPTTFQETLSENAGLMAEQIKAWRAILPTLIHKFSRIEDYPRTKSVMHKMVVLMIFGLFAFVFRLSSRREINRELTGVIIHQHLRKIFPVLDSIPHADTLARILRHINLKKIEAAHIDLIKELIYKKNFKKLLINSCVPISVDGAQKLFRNGILHYSHWLQRTIGKKKL
jgi:hypothetical protein